MNQLLLIDLKAKTIRVVGERRFLAEYTYDDLSDIDPLMLEQIRLTDYNKPFTEVPE